MYPPLQFVIECTEDDHMKNITLPNAKRNHFVAEYSNMHNVDFSAIITLKICMLVTFNAIYQWYLSRNSGRILIKFDMDIMPLEATLKSSFLISYIRYF
jgi:hypothetical protein